MKPLGAVPLCAIKNVIVLEPEIKKDPYTAFSEKMHRIELILKDDFLELYFDPYYDVALSDDKTKLVITLDKKKSELQHFQDEGIDYFSSPIDKSKLINSYLNESTGVMKSPETNYQNDNTRLEYVNESVKLLD